MNNSIFFQKGRISNKSAKIAKNDDFLIKKSFLLMKNEKLGYFCFFEPSTLTFEYCAAYLVSHFILSHTIKDFNQLYDFCIENNLINNYR